MSNRKVACVTGASGGIGQAICRRLAADGYAVAALYRTDRESAENLVADLLNNGADAAAFFCDVADRDSVVQAAEAVTARFGTVTALVNNAGIAQTKLFTDLSEEDWQRMIAVNLTGAFHTCRTFLPEMIRRHEGAIVNISSIWGQTGGSCEVHYSAAKAGLIGMTQALAKEVGPAGIRVNCVAPGVIETAMLGNLTDDDRRQLAEDTPLCRLGTPDDVAGAVAFLLSENAQFITGQTIAPNGGLYI